MDQTACNTPQAVNPQELATANSLLAHFSQMEKQYKEYDRVCEQIPYYGPGSSRTPFILAALIAIVASLLILFCCISGTFESAAYIFGLSQIPCFFLVGGGLLVYRKNRINYRNCCNQYLELCQQLQDHYALYADYPIPAAYTNPKALNAIRTRIANGQSATVDDALGQILSDFSRNQISQLFARIEHYTKHLPQPETQFFPGKFFSAKPGNFKDAAKRYMNFG